MSISVESKAYGKRRYYQSWSESLSHSFSESSLESSESLSRCPSPQKKHGSGSKRDYAGFKQTGYRQSKSHAPVNKKEKNIHWSKHEKNAKADRGVDPLMNIEESENNHTTSEVIHDL